MFKIVSSFTRETSDHEFFNDLYINYDLLKKLRKNAETIPGYLGMDEYVYRDEFKCDKALCFDSEESFNLFVVQNQDILVKRKQIIEEYCQRTGHVYKYYVIK
jgi:hypothetical protein